MHAAYPDAQLTEWKPAVKRTKTLPARHLVAGNTVWDNVYGGIVVSGGARVRLEGNSVQYNGRAGVCVQWSAHDKLVAAEKKTDGTALVELEDNTIAHNVMLKERPRARR